MERCRDGDPGLVRQGHAEEDLASFPGDTVDGCRQPRRAMTYEEPAALAEWLRFLAHPVAVGEHPAGYRRLEHRARRTGQLFRCARDGELRPDKPLLGVELGPQPAGRDRRFARRTKLCLGNHSRSSAGCNARAEALQLGSTIRGASVHIVAPRMAKLAVCMRSCSTRAVAHGPDQGERRSRSGRASFPNGRFRRPRARRDPAGRSHSGSRRIPFRARRALLAGGGFSIRFPTAPWVAQPPRSAGTLHIPRPAVPRSARRIHPWAIEGCGRRRAGPQTAHPRRQCSPRGTNPPDPVAGQGTGTAFRR